MKGWGMKKTLPCFLGQTPHCREVLGQQQLWCSSQISRVDPVSFPELGLFMFHDHPVCSVVPNNALTSLSPSVNWGALEGVFSYFSWSIHTIDYNLKTRVGTGKFFPSMIPCTGRPYPESVRETCPGFWDWILNKRNFSYWVLHVLHCIYFFFFLNPNPYIIR